MSRQVVSIGSARLWLRPATFHYSATRISRAGSVTARAQVVKSYLSRFSLFARWHAIWRLNHACGCVAKWDLDLKDTKVNSSSIGIFGPIAHLILRVNAVGKVHTPSKAVLYLPADGECHGEQETPHPIANRVGRCELIALPIDRLRLYLGKPFKIALYGLSICRGF